MVPPGRVLVLRVVLRSNNRSMELFGREKAANDGVLVNGVMQRFEVYQADNLGTEDV